MLKLLFFLMLLTPCLYGTATTSVTCGGVTTTSFSASSCAQDNISADASVSSGAASVTVFEATARADIERDFTLLITGGTGQGIYRLIGTGTLIADSFDTDYYDIRFGPTRIYQDQSGHIILNEFASFVYDVPQILHLSLVAYAEVQPPHKQFGGATATFDHIDAINEPILTPIPGVTVSLTPVVAALPEPAGLPLAVGMISLGLAAIRRHYGAALITTVPPVDTTEIPPPAR